MIDSAPEARTAERVLLCGFVAVVLIVIAGCVVIGLSASENGQAVADVVGSGLGVIGTLGGAFVGHRLGSAGRRETEKRLDDLHHHLLERVAKPTSPPAHGEQAGGGPVRE